MVDAYVSVDHTGTAEPVRNHVCARSNGVRDAAVMISIAPSIGLLCLKLNGTKGRTDREMGVLSWGFLMTCVAALPWMQLMTTQHPDGVKGTRLAVFPVCRLMLCALPYSEPSVSL